LELQGVTILFDTETGNKKRLIDITKLAQQYQQELCTALLGLHAFTRCDTMSAFKGIGKVKAIKTLQKSPQFQSALE
jgi:5'-3' exonuclease